MNIDNDDFDFEVFCEVTLEEQDVQDELYRIGDSVLPSDSAGQRIDLVRQQARAILGSLEARLSGVDGSGRASKGGVR